MSHCRMWAWATPAPSQNEAITPKIFGNMLAIEPLVSRTMCSVQPSRSRPHSTTPSSRSAPRRDAFA